MESSLLRGLPLSLSRWTDVAHWYMPWLRKLITHQGFVFAPDPSDAVLKKWNLDPEEVLALYFWTKNPEALTGPLLTWLSPYRVYVAVTITGWEEQEPRVPTLREQIRGLETLTEILGPDKIRIRYSPIPTDFLTNPSRQRSYTELLQVMLDLGLTSLDVSFLHGDGYYPSSYIGGRQETFERVSGRALGCGLVPGFCGEDWHQFKNTANIRHTSCIDAQELMRVFNIKFSHRQEPSCNCTQSIDPCLGPKFGCGSGCNYCYAPYTPKSRRV